MQLTKGRSPGDIPESLRFPRYDLVFIDGLHTVKQCQLDFEGIHPCLAPHRFVAVFPDVRVTQLERCISDVLRKNPADQYRSFLKSMGSFGTGVLYFGYPEGTFDALGPRFGAESVPEIRGRSYPARNPTVPANAH